LAERHWNMWIPGFGSDEVRPYKRSATTEAHKQVTHFSYSSYCVLENLYPQYLITVVLAFHGQWGKQCSLLGAWGEWRTNRINDYFSWLVSVLPSCLHCFKVKWDSCSTLEWVQLATRAPSIARVKGLTQQSIKTCAVYPKGSGLEEGNCTYKTGCCPW